LTRYYIAVKVLAMKLHHCRPLSECVCILLLALLCGSPFERAAAAETWRLEPRATGLGTAPASWDADLRGLDAYHLAPSDDALPLHPALLAIGKGLAAAGEPGARADAHARVTRPGDGYRGIWFTLGQFSEHGDKYSGGLGTYTANHLPLAIYAPEVERTFFVYGGTTRADERHLLIMAGSYNHRSGQVARPQIVHDKLGVDDPHDNPSLAIDDRGHLWIFISGRGRSRPGYIYRSCQPWDITDFEFVAAREMTYP
jgi:hypothetical protein